VITALAHGLIGSVLAVLLGLVAALVPQPPVGPSGAYNGPTPTIALQPSRPIVKRPVVLTIAGLPAAVRDLRLVGARSLPHPIGHGDWRIRLRAPAQPGPWMITLDFRLHGTAYSIPGAVVQVALHR